MVPDHGPSQLEYFQETVSVSWSHLVWWPQEATGQWTVASPNWDVDFENADFQRLSIPKNKNKNKTPH